MVIFLISTFAEELYSKGDYFRALTEYKREFFLGGDTLNSMKMIAECYKNLGDYEKALYWYGRLNFIDDTFENEYKYLLGITLNIEDLKILIDEDEIELSRIISNYESVSQKIYFSYIIPGSSQIIYGKYREGIFSLFWNAVSLYYLFSRIREKDYIGAVFTFPLFIKFYMGNIDFTKRLEREDSYKKLRMDLDKYFGY